MHLLLEVSTTALPDTILLFSSMAAPRPLWTDHHLPRRLTESAAAPLLRPDSKVVERRADGADRTAVPGDRSKNRINHCRHSESLFSKRTEITADVAARTAQEPR